MAPMTRLFALLLGTSIAVVCATPPHRAEAAPAKKKYHFELTEVKAKSTVKEDIAKSATPRVESQIKSALDSHPQVGKADGAPDPKTKPEDYRKFLTSHNLSGAYYLTVEVTEATEEVVPVEDKKSSQRLVIHVAIHMLAENIPGRTIGFVGDGQATVKQEVGMKIRDRDRESTWDEASKVAVDDALTKIFAQLAIPPRKQ